MKSAAATAALLLATLFAVAPRAQEQPVFRARTDLVLVDAAVLDRDGSPVRDLTAADFAVEVDGQPRAVVSAEFVEAGASTTTAVVEPAAAAREALTTSNALAGAGRLLLFVADEDHLRVGAARTVLRSAERMLERLGPADAAGLVRLPDGTGSVDFTADRERVRDGLRRVTGRMGRVDRIQRVGLAEAVAYERGGMEWEAAIARVCGGEAAGSPGRELCVSDMQSQAQALAAEQSETTARTVRALEGIMRRLAGVDRPVTMVLISEGLVMARERPDMRRLGRLAAEARVTLQVLHLAQDLFDIEAPAGERTVTTMDESLLVEGLARLAAEARGGIFRVAGTGAGVFDRLSREMAGYYLLAFEPAAGERPNAERRVKVEVRRRGLTVRARPTFVARGASSAARDAATAGEPTARLQQLVASPLPSAGLPLRLATYTATASAEGKLRLIIAAEVGGEPGAARDLSFALALLDPAGKVVAAAGQTARVTPVEGAATGGLLLTSLLVAPGDYTLRLAVVDGDRGGSVHHPLSARLREAGDGLRASDLVLAAASAARDTGPRPTAAGVFATDRVTALLELEGAPELLRRTQVRVQVAATADGPALATAEARGASRAGGRQRAFDAAVPLGLLPPGEYVARAVIILPGRRDATVVRPFRREAIAVTATPTAPNAPAPTRILAPVPRFDPAVVLRPSTVAGYLDALHAVAPPTPELASLVSEARAGTFASPPSDAQVAPQDEVTLAFLRGLAALQKGEPAQATAWFRQTARGASEFIGSTFYLGAALAAQGQDREAVGAWQMALLGDQPATVYPPLVDALLRLGEAREALDLMAEAPEAFTPAERERRTAAAQAMLGELAPALDALTRLLDASPRDPDLLFTALQVLYRMRSDGGQPLPDEQRRRFVAWADAYAAAGGPQLALVAQWRTFVAP